MTDTETAERLAAPPRLDLGLTALFLDLDGAVAPIAPTPDAVKPDARRNGLLAALRERAGGRLAVISGRPIADVDRILEGAVTAAAGVHGLERRRQDGAVIRAPAHPGVAVAKAAFEALAGADPGLLVEDKGLSVALHYRRSPDCADAVQETARRIAAQERLTLQAGDMVVELRTPGADKGDALRVFMAERPFAGHAPVFVGDDLTDEDAFAAARDLGGFGVLVGPGRPTAARFRLPDVEAVLAWLEAAA
ncbi:trehalose-phosphatase [Caulobacter sp. CCUG 60055]|uniref:trehalose-phosphatase n=1 Tax=Caulobacter sp. CCUG 60055 TaxID=2100090 RepID=UPI001FA72A4B|nr:trehalose-phosphatase [Caulobacter sp. CCUG 60055]MBQ1543913.1 trehalose-phosphatase [Caulobacteraceae bacterium]MCI3180626.1 trehalose-phosphatase [Caulobacter sp. CCUG 60055]